MEISNLESTHGKCRVSHEEVCRILMVEDDEAIVRAVCAAITKDASLDIVDIASTLKQGYQIVQQRHDVLLLDLGLPDGSGVELLKYIRDCGITTKVLIFTVFSDSHSTLAALRAGADGYVLKDDANLIAKIKMLVAGKNPIAPAVTQHILKEIQRPLTRDLSESVENIVALSPRERETLTGLAQGMSYKDIAKAMNISRNTLTDYSKDLYKKLGVNSRGEAVYEGVRLGLISFRS